MKTHVLRLGAAAILGAALAAVAAPGPSHAQTPPAAPALPGFCGTVTSFIPATATATGSISFSGVNTNQMYTIAAGTVLGGQTALQTLTNVCLQFTTNAAGAISGGQFVPNSSLQAIVCGTVSGYTAASTAAGGTVTIGGLTFLLGQGATFAGAAPTTGQVQQFSFTMNGLGVITGGTVAAGTCTGTTVAGPFGVFIPATATTPGLLTFGAVTIVIPAGTRVTVTHSVPLAAYPVFSWQRPAFRPGHTGAE